MTDHAGRYIAARHWHRWSVQDQAHNPPRIVSKHDTREQAQARRRPPQPPGGNHLMLDLPRRYKRPTGLNYSTSPAARRLRTAVFVRDNYTCAGCDYRPPVVPANYDGRHTLGDLTLDHVVPAYRGGLWRLANLQTMCRRCNARKGTT